MREELGEIKTNLCTKKTLYTININNQRKGNGNISQFVKTVV